MNAAPDVSFEPTCLVNGRKFICSGDQWIDVMIRQRPELPSVRIRFDSREYFELLGHYPEALAFTQLGRNLQFIAGDRIYEIYE